MRCSSEYTFLRRSITWGGFVALLRGVNFDGLVEQIPQGIDAINAHVEEAPARYRPAGPEVALGHLLAPRSLPLYAASFPYNLRSSSLAFSRRCSRFSGRFLPARLI